MTIKAPRYLITTADERTWRFDRPVLFLGEWCRLYERQEIWREMDAIVAAPYGLSKTQRDADHAEARSLEQELFPILCDVLNQHHGTHHGARFWKILVGHWLRQYVDVILNRVKTLQQCLQNHQLSGTSTYSGEHYMLATLDSNAAIWAVNDDRWNLALYVRILNLLAVPRCPVEIIPGAAAEGYRLPAPGTGVPLRRRMLQRAYRQARRLCGFLSRDNDAFIINSYLPKKEEVKFQIALGQVPQLWASPEPKLSKSPNHLLRRNLADQVAGISTDTLSAILHALVFELMPSCYLENFAELVENSRKLPWPNTPKFILTSNNFHTDEMFKIWAADKIEAGVPYYVGQHGNNYGVTRNHLNPSIEELTADKFLTWGWADGLPQHTPAFVFKTVGHKPLTYSPNGGLLLIELCIGHRITSWDSTYEFAAYFQAQQDFIDGLRNAPRNDLTVRLQAAYRYLKWNEEQRWYQFDPDLKIDLGTSAISKLISQSRLIVHSYDSTGILETLSQNIPILAFWQNDLDHLRESAKPYYQLLIEAGIFHLTPESAAAKVNEVWGDIDGWWNQSIVQDARKKFCDRYARVSGSPIQELKKLLHS